MKPDDLPFMPNKAELERLLKERIDPDAERFRYLASAMLDMAGPGAQTLAHIMDLSQPTTLDDMRNCVDAASTLTPLGKEPT